MANLGSNPFQPIQVKRFKVVTSFGIEKLIKNAETKNRPE